MEKNLQFVISTIGGVTYKQEIKCPEEMVEAAISQTLSQYAQVGFLRKEGSKYMLIPASQITRVTCDPQVSLIVTANPSDVPKVAQAANTLHGLTRVK